MTSKARLFYSKELKKGLISKLSESQSHYTKNVMRLKPGDKISLFNSSSGEWDVSILTQGKDLTEFKVENFVGIFLARNVNAVSKQIISRWTWPWAFNPRKSRRIH